MLQIPESKIAVPALPVPFVPRPGLLGALGGDDPTDERVTLVCAPAGYGKTTLLAHWALAAGTGPGPAWVNLDSADDDPRRLQTGILAALTAHPAVPADGRLRELARTVRSGGYQAPPSFVAELVHAFDGLAVRVPLVLHDVHELAAPAALRELETIVAARPPGLRLVLSSRLDPPLSLGTLRSAGLLRQLRADRLRFSAEATGAVLGQQGLRLTPAQTRELHACTHGWPTGVRLAGTVLCAGTDPDAFLARFAGDSRPVADFLVGEVLGGLPDPDRKLLAAAAANVPLADEEHAGLERLGRTTGLVTLAHGPVPGYRVDPLVAAYLRTERVHRSRSTEGPHGRAAGSGQGEGVPVAALQRAIGGGDDALIGRWMLAYGALLRCEPAEARDVAAEALQQRGRARSPHLEFALRVVHGAALFDAGARHRGLQEMQQARTDLGTVALAREQAAALAVLEHRAALTLGRPDVARAVSEWLSQRSGAGGEVLLMRAWAALWTGRDQVARSAVRPLLDGSVAGLLPHTLVEALLVETAAGVTAGEIHGARRALRSALSLGAPLDVVRPFAMAEPPARALLGHHLGRDRTYEPFVARALAAGRGAHRPRTTPLTDTELSMIKLLPSPLSIGQIAVELDIGGSEVAHGMLRTVYRKLGASSRRTAVTAAFERRLLR